MTITLTPTGSRLPQRLKATDTPSRVRLLAGASALLAAILGGTILTGAGDLRTGIEEIGHHAAPQVVATSDLYFALNDMDAQLANVLLVGGDTTLGVGRSQALKIFEQRRLQANGDIQQAAAAAGDDRSAQKALRSVLDGLGRYEALAAETILLDGAAHPAGQPPARALARYRQATDLLKSDVLPAVNALTEANATKLERTYQGKRDAMTRTEVQVGVISTSLLAVLVVLQIFLSRRFHRRVSLRLMLATLGTAMLALSGLQTLASGDEHLRGAKKDAFDSVLALSRARAISYDANADESRFLVDSGRAGPYQQGFLDKSQLLLRLPGATIPTYDDALTSAVNTDQRDHQNVGFDGYFGTAFRNITFTGERDAAEKTLTTFQVYQRDDRRMRDLARNGGLRATIAFNTGYAPGDSNHDFDAYDKALSSWIELNQKAFDQAITDGEDTISGWTLLPPVAAVILICFVLAGVRPRLAEFR